MSGSEQTDIWQVEVNGQVYEASFGELPEWIAGGSLLPTDKVRRGNLRWVPARQVPKLLPFFNAKERGEQIPIVVTTTDSANVEPINPMADTQNFIPAIDPHPRPKTISPSSTGAPGSFCVNHAEITAVFACPNCGGTFCRACPASYGGSVKICPSCGGMCQEIGGKGTAASRKTGGSFPASGQFGFGDLISAFAHPFKFKTSLIVGGAMFAALSLGQSVSAFGGIMMMVGALFCLMLANTLTFGVLSHTVDRFSQGDVESDFMPSFDDFSAWDNVVHPFFLSIGAYLVSFGPFIATLLVGLYLVMSSISTFDKAVASDLEKIPGTDYYAGRQTAEQSAQVKDVLTKIADDRDAQIEAMNEAATGNSDAVVVDEDAREQEELWAMAQQNRRDQLESALGKTPETRERETQAMMSGFLNLAAPLVVIGAISFLWGVFFFPAASAVAGYTRSFMATVNPLVGLDTIRRLGLDYIKILAMGIVIVLVSGIVSGLAGAIFAPLDLPGLGNLPAKAIGSFVGFYLFAVFSCVLGYALLKAADRLDLPR